MFLGAKPSNTPSFYSFMNYADFGLGTWHPKVACMKLLKPWRALATKLGVTIHTITAVEKISGMMEEPGITVNGCNRI